MTVICPTFLLESGLFLGSIYCCYNSMTFSISSSKFGVKTSLPMLFFDFINAPETSSVQLVTGVYFTVVDRFVYEDQFLFAGRLEDIMQTVSGTKSVMPSSSRTSRFSAISTLSPKSTCPPTEVSHVPPVVCLSIRDVSADTAHLWN